MNVDVRVPRRANRSAKSRLSRGTSKRAIGSIATRRSSNWKPIRRRWSWNRRFRVPSPRSCIRQAKLCRWANSSRSSTKRRNRGRLLRRRPRGRTPLRPPRRLRRPRMSRLHLPPQLRPLTVPARRRAASRRASPGHARTEGRRGCGNRRWRTADERRCPAAGRRPELRGRCRRSGRPSPLGARLFRLRPHQNLPRRHGARHCSPRPRCAPPPSCQAAPRGLRGRR